MPVTRSMTRRLERMNVNCHLLKLSNDALFLIYLQVSSIDAVWALMSTCCRLWAALHLNPVCVIEAVLANEMPDEVAEIMRAVWNLRSCKSTMRMPLSAMRSIDDGHFQSPLNRQMTPRFVRNFMALAIKIHGLAHVILKDCLTNLSNMREKLYPFPMLYPGMEELNAHKQGGATRADPTPFLAPPSWAEELRMMQGLWLCEFHGSLLKARARGDGLVCAELGHLSAAELCLEGFFVHDWRGTFWTIHRGLDAIVDHSDESDAPDNRAVELPFSMPLSQKLRPDDYKRALEAARNCRGTFKSSLLMPGDMSWKELMLDMDTEAEGYKYLTERPMGIVVPSEYAHLGLLHWCQPRMHGLGFSYRDDDRIHRMWRRRILDYWLSLLPAFW